MNEGRIKIQRMANVNFLEWNRAPELSAHVAQVWKNVLVSVAALHAVRADVEHNQWRQDIRKDFFSCQVQLMCAKSQAFHRLNDAILCRLVFRQAMTLESKRGQSLSNFDCVFNSGWKVAKTNLRRTEALKRANANAQSDFDASDCLDL